MNPPKSGMIVREIRRNVMAGLPIAHHDLGLDDRADHPPELDRNLVRTRLTERILKEEILAGLELGVAIGQIHDEDLAQLVEPTGADNKPSVVVPEIGIFVLEIGVIGFNIETVLGAGPVGELDGGKVLLVPAVAPVELATRIDFAILKVAFHVFVGHIEDDPAGEFKPGEEVEEMTPFVIELVILIVTILRRVREEQVRLVDGQLELEPRTRHPDPVGDGIGGCEKDIVAVLPVQLERRSEEEWADGDRLVRIRFTSLRLDAGLSAIGVSLLS